MIWWLFPLPALLFFLLMSANHFASRNLLIGASNSPWASLLYGAWGTALLCGLVALNLPSLTILLQEKLVFEVLNRILDSLPWESLSLGAMATTLAALLFVALYGKMGWHLPAIEVGIMGLLAGAFWVLPPSSTLCFCIPSG